MSRRDDNEHHVDLGDLDISDAGSDPGVDEDLPEPPGGGRVYSRRARILVAAVITVALVALVVVRALTTGGTTSTASNVSPGPSTSVATHPDVTASASRGGQQAEQCADLTCGQEVHLQIETAVPMAVLTAVRKQYRGARIVTGRNVLDSDATTLLYRRVVARLGIRTITLTVVPYRTGDANRGGFKDAASGSSVYVEQRLGNWQVSVRVTAPVGTHLTLGPPMRLAQDARILA